ncbi:MAG TPA: SH3 domain-containing protein [Sphingomonas sp.]
MPNPGFTDHAPAPTRERFALTGPSVRLDPRTHAVRPDLADVRLADRVFAPHYAAPMPRRVARPVRLRPGRDDGAETLVELREGEPFDVLEVAGRKAWGVAPGCGLVGYLDADALTRG